MDASDWSVDALNWAIGSKLMSGKGNGILDPDGNATRAEVAAMIERFCSHIN
ncbi:MAG: S-layer homology domain-containing protein [Syntrophomonadaceae bacterium]